MSFNGSGLFQINTTGQPVVTGTTISSTAQNALTSDLATGLSTAICKDGQTTVTANIPFNGFKLTGVGPGTAATDAANFGQLSTFGVPGYTTTATAAGSTTLSVASTYEQYFTGVTTQTVVLPVTTTLVLGFQFLIVNNSSGVVTVNSSGGNLVVAMVPNSAVLLTCILASGTTAASWDVKYAGMTSVTGTGAMVLGTSPTLTTPTFSANAIPNTALAQMPANTIKGNNTAGTANAADLTVAQLELMLSGMPIQQVFTETGAVATGSGTIPGDDTIPQNTEGDQYMSLAITPKSSTSTLVIEIVAVVAASAAAAVEAALFQDANANALAAAWQRIDTPGQPICLSFRHMMTSGSTSATTFKVRIGSNNGVTLTLNGTAGGRIFGGVMASSVRITEVLA